LRLCRPPPTHPTPAPRRLAPCPAWMPAQRLHPMPAHLGHDGGMREWPLSGVGAWRPPIAMECDTLLDG
jgi:hypothetical protein